MAPPTLLSRLVALQVARESEIERLRLRLMNKPRESLSRSIIQSRLDALKVIWKEVRQTHSEIVVREAAENDAYTAEGWYDRIEGVYEETLDSVLTLMLEIDNSAGAAIDADDSVVAGGSGVAKLPRISLPTFSGDYEDWASFRDLFTTLIHDVQSLSDATKLQYLKLCLTGNAADLIKDVSTTSANYISTWESLQTRYYNPRLIINKHLTSLMELPQLKKESASLLRSFLDEAQRIVRALTNLNLPVEHWDVWLIFVLSERLDSESRKLWESELSQVKSGGEEGTAESDIESLPKFADFVRFLEQRTQALTMSAQERRGEKRPAPAPAMGSHARKVFHAVPAHSSKVGSITCSVCSGAHPTAKCFKLQSKNPSERLAVVRQLQLCFNCLRKHRVNACLSGGRCAICQKKHHTMLHLNAPGTQRGSGDPSKSKESGSAANKSVISLHASRTSASTRKILLATARITIEGPNGGRTVVRALLDQGSESSFVSESIVQLLGLSQQRTCVVLSGLGSSAAGTARANVQLVLRSSNDPNFKLETDALVLPKLTSHLPSDNLGDFDLRPFFGLSLADSEFSISKKVDVILGADVYGQLLRPGLKRFSSSSVIAQNTVFGWIISGPLQPGSRRRAEGGLSPLPIHALHCTCDPSLDESLQRFWNLEEIN